MGVSPVSLLEPTCGQGVLLDAALTAFPNVAHAVGVEINNKHIAIARGHLSVKYPSRDITIRQDDFFTTDWAEILRTLPDPLLIIGNPPWVTNTTLGILNSRNAPLKENSRGYQGIDAITGKSNFDISEWMLTRMLEWVSGRNAVLAMLCKTTAARKALAHTWEHAFPLGKAAIHRIDAHEAFGAAVDACLLVVRSRPVVIDYECSDFSSLFDPQPGTSFGYRDHQLIADIPQFSRWRHLAGAGGSWRSGVKHDCARVFELRRNRDAYRNALNQSVEIEPDMVFPMLKSSDVAAGRIKSPSRFMLITQSAIGEDTQQMRLTHPKTWEYLVQHAELLDGRASRIYRGRPRFAIFGVGPYTFAPWKVAISGFYKQLAFRVVGPYENKPIVFDDTCYFLPCKTQNDAETIGALLHSEAARSFLSSLIFWDAKRPITAGILQQLDLVALARELNVPEERVTRVLASTPVHPMSGDTQLALFSRR